MLFALILSKPMNREDAARIYLNCLINKETEEINSFFEAAKVLSEDDKVKIKMSVERYRIDGKKLIDIKKTFGSP